MRNQILTLSLAVMSIASFAQKKELKVAEKALKNNDYAGAMTAIQSAEGLIANADEKYKSKFYFLKGKTLAGKKDYKAAAAAFNELKAFEKQSGKNRYSSEAAPILNSMIQDVSKKAIDLYNNKKDYKAAAESFYLTYKLSPNDTSFVYNAAVSATQAKEYDNALKYYRELQTLGYTGVETQYIATNKATGKVENFQGDINRRDIMVRGKTHIKPETKVSEGKSATIVKNIALILKEQGKTDEAIAAMKDARKANPKDLNLILNEAQLYIEMKDMAKFGELMNEAVALDPENPTLYYNLGVVNANQKRSAEAKKYYQKAIELKPDYTDAYMNIAATILDSEQSIVDKMNALPPSDMKGYDKLEKERKDLYKEALPYLEKADALGRSEATVKTLKSIYENLEMEAKASEYRALLKSMKQ